MVGRYGEHLQAMQIVAIRGADSYFRGAETVGGQRAIGELRDERGRCQGAAQGERAHH